ncbi:MAG TPA: hypothetical protein PLP17_12465, partial [Oligoflexia bacterium]|nr:hypothetical protein [Oligoflexia bacterium]
VRERPGASYFLRGSGEVRYESEGFSVKPAETEVVVKFRYFPKVKTSSPQEVEIYPVPAFTQQLDDLKTGKEVSFIGLRVKPEFIARGKKIYVGYFPARTERLAKQND